MGKGLNGGLMPKRGERIFLETTSGQKKTRDEKDVGEVSMLISNLAVHQGTAR